MSSSYLFHPFRRSKPPPSKPFPPEPGPGLADHGLFETDSTSTSSTSRFNFILESTKLGPSQTHTKQVSFTGHRDGTHRAPPKEDKKGKHDHGHGHHGHHDHDDDDDHHHGHHGHHGHGHHDHDHGHHDSDEPKSTHRSSEPKIREAAAVGAGNPDAEDHKSEHEAKSDHSHHSHHKHHHESEKGEKDEHHKHHTRDAATTGGAEDEKKKDDSKEGEKATAHKAQHSSGKSGGPGGAPPSKSEAHNKLMSLVARSKKMTEAELLAELENMVGRGSGGGDDGLGGFRMPAKNFNRGATGGYGSRMVVDPPEMSARSKAQIEQDVQRDLEAARALKMGASLRNKGLTAGQPLKVFADHSVSGITRALDVVAEENQVLKKQFEEQVERGRQEQRLLMLRIANLEAELNVRKIQSERDFFERGRLRREGMGAAAGQSHLGTLLLRAVRQLLKIRSYDLSMQEIQAIWRTVNALNNLDSSDGISNSNNSAGALSPSDMNLLIGDLTRQMQLEKTSVVPWGGFELDLPKQFFRVFRPGRLESLGNFRGSEYSLDDSIKTVKPVDLESGGLNSNIDNEIVMRGIVGVVESYLEKMSPGKKKEVRL